MYKIYGNNVDTGYELVNVLQDLEIAYSECHELQEQDNNYNKILLIESDGKTDSVLELYFKKAKTKTFKK